MAGDCVIYRCAREVRGFSTREDWFERKGDMVKRATLLLVAICCCALASCFEWTEDPHGNLQSVGVPGVPIWKSSKPPAPLTPTEAGFSPEEASKVSGSVLVEPPSSSVKVYRYKYYQTGNNNCQEDLKRMLAERAASNETGTEPYCTDNASSTPVTVPPTSSSPMPPAAKGGAFVF
jgi:hypothetical protein